MHLSLQGEESVVASYFMTYHTILKTSRDYYEALLWARQISDNITQTINAGGMNPTVEVFPYRWEVQSRMEEMDCTGYKKNDQHPHRFSTQLWFPLSMIMIQCCKKSDNS